MKAHRNHPHHFIRPFLFCGVLAIPLAAQAGPEMSYGLGFNGDLWGSSFSSSFDFDDEFGISGARINLDGPNLRAQAGDVSANWDQLGLAGRSFQGLSTGFAVGKVDLSLLGGTVVLQPDYLDRRLGDLLAIIPQPIVSPIYGARVAFPLGNKFDMSASQLIAPNASQAQGKNISTLALNYAHSARRRLGLEVARSKGGNGWQLSGATEGKRLKLQASYRQAGLGFSTAGNPTLLLRRNGGFVNFNYRLSEPLTLTANAQRYNDGREGRTSYDSLGLRYAKRKQPTLDIFWRRAQSQRADRTALDIGSTPGIATASTSMGIRVAHRLGVNRVSAQVERLQFNSTSPLIDDSTSHRFNLGLSRPLGKQTNVSVFQILDVGTAGRTAYTSLNLSRRFKNSGLTTDLGLQYVNRSAAGISGQATAVRAGLRYIFRSGSSIGVQYQTTVAGSGSLGARGIDQLYLGYSHSFNSGAGRRQNLSLQERRQLGKVAGRVFEDKSGEGQWQSGEPGVPDVGVNINGGSQQQTDESGRFSMADVRPGNYQFGLETKTLPIEFTTLNAGDVSLQVVAGKSATLDIPVVRTGQAKGIVFSDVNRNGVRDEGETGIANAIVQAEGSDVIGFTDAQGNFTLHGLAPKTWSLSVNTGVLGEDMEATGEGKTSVKVPANGEVAGIALGVAEKERAVINSFENIQ